MSIWPASLIMKGVSKLMSWVLSTFSGALVNATVLTLLLKSFARKKRFSRGVLANTARSLRFLCLEALPFLTPDGITDFGIALAKHCTFVSALSFYKPIDQKPFLTDHAITCGLTSFICLRCNTRIETIGAKVRFYHTLPFITKQRAQFDCGYPQTAQESTESLILTSNHNRTSFAA